VVKNYVLIISIFIFGCAPKNKTEIISKDIFFQILLDYENIQPLSQDTSSSLVLSRICSKYGETLESYDLTMNRYLDKPEEMLLILNELKDSVL